ncbi:MAG TPA: hypothetical protein VK437_12975 [Steroidobacteraceae bacterium]|nr:hypothetical protein [Steroidobacteraceae bacterium]
MRTLNRLLGSSVNFWSQPREAALNWLALGLLLAAWNTADDGNCADAPAAGRRPEALRPQTLRGYACVSVRALARCATIDR